MDLKFWEKINADTTYFNQKKIPLLFSNKYYDAK